MLQVDKRISNIKEEFDEREEREEREEKETSKNISINKNSNFLSIVII